jgi:hypothetical protein
VRQRLVDFLVAQRAIVIPVEVLEAGLHVGEEVVQLLELVERDRAAVVAVVDPAGRRAEGGALGPMEVMARRAIELELRLQLHRLHPRRELAPPDDVCHGRQAEVQASQLQRAL